jgi:hypothetical protein
MHSGQGEVLLVYASLVMCDAHLEALCQFDLAFPTQGCLLGIVLGRQNVALPEPFCSKLEVYNVDAHAFTDANWATGIDDKKSTSGLLLHVYT